MPGYHALRLPERYRALLDLPPAAFAWEWLRRNPEYRTLWATAPAAAGRASAHAIAAARRDAGIVTVIPQHPLGSRSANLGLTFPASPEVPATDQPLLGWSPELHTNAITVVRPVPWARSVASLRFTPSRWGRAYRLETEGGAHLLIRRQGAPELSLWLPAELEPAEGEPFGLYVHPDGHHAARVAAVARFRRAIGIGPPLRVMRFRGAHRQAAMLAIHDAVAAGTSLRDIAQTLLPVVPDEWRTSAERSDLRRLQEGAVRLSAFGYPSLLRGTP
jgi:hypothetical protein